MHQILTHIFCCDWGTSSLRLRLVERETLHVAAHVQTAEGIGRLFSIWSSLEASGESRQDYLLEALSRHVSKIQEQVSFAVSHIPIVMSGMASSSIGLKEIPYAHLPFSIVGKDISAEYIAETPDFAHDIYLISGVQSDSDVIRGEEIEVIGLSAMGTLNIPEFSGGNILVLPGTHAKHILIKDQKIVSFKTFMTGEFFSLLTENSILKDSIHTLDSSELTHSAYRTAFSNGVETARANNLLHASFLARTNHLFGKFTKEENSFFLSGLVIGYELLDLSEESEVSRLVICCGEKLLEQYRLACQVLGYINVTYIPSATLEQAIVMGQIAVYNRFSKNNPNEKYHV